MYFKCLKRNANVVLFLSAKDSPGCCMPKNRKNIFHGKELIWSNPWWCSRVSISCNLSISSGLLHWNRTNVIIYTPPPPHTHTPSGKGSPCSSVPRFVRPSVDGIASARYLPKYSLFPRWCLGMGIFPSHTRIWSYSWAMQHSRVNGCITNTKIPGVTYTYAIGRSSGIAPTIRWMNKYLPK